MKFLIFASVPTAKKTKGISYGNEIFDFCIRSYCKKNHQKNDIIESYVHGLRQVASLTLRQLNITSYLLYRFFVVRGTLLRFAPSLRSLRSLIRCSPPFQVALRCPPNPQGRTPTLRSVVSFATLSYSVLAGFSAPLRRPQNPSPVAVKVILNLKTKTSFYFKIKSQNAINLNCKISFSN